MDAAALAGGSMQASHQASNLPFNVNTGKVVTLPVLLPCFSSRFWPRPSCRTAPSHVAPGLQPAIQRQQGEKPFRSDIPEAENKCSLKAELYASHQRPATLLQLSSTKQLPWVDSNTHAKGTFTMQQNCTGLRHMTLLKSHPETKKEDSGISSWLQARKTCSTTCPARAARCWTSPSRLQPSTAPTAPSPVRFSYLACLHNLFGSVILVRLSQILLWSSSSPARTPPSLAAQYQAEPAQHQVCRRPTSFVTRFSPLAH